MLASYKYLMPYGTEYYGESLQDLAKMPTTTKLGEAPYDKALAAEGSWAKIVTTSGLKRYILRTTGWVEVTNAGSSSGGSSGSEVPEGYTLAEDSDIINLFP